MRLNLPAILVPGGPMLTGRFQGTDTIITDLDAETWACGVGKPRLSPEALAEPAERGAGIPVRLG